MQIFISGSLAYDRIMNFPGKFADHILPEKIHILNVCFLVNGLNEQFGGTAGNIAYSLSLLGEKPMILATAGKDFRRYAEWLEHLGLPREGIRQIADEFTAGAYITTDQMDNQITGFNPGAMNHPSEFPFHNGSAPPDSIAIIAPGNTDDMIAYSRYYKAAGIPYIFDPGQQIPVLSSSALTEMITGADIFISNDYELEMVKKATALAPEKMLARCRVLITTLGDKGSVITTHDTQKALPAVAAQSVVDPTGAGDAYRAGLIKGLVSQKSIFDSGKMGAVCASFAVEAYGTQIHQFTLDEFWQRYENHFSARDAS